MLVKHSGGDSMIAEVVVDVKSKTVDKVFDYAVPSLLRSVIQPGMRVVVPFGPRVLSGFVMSLKPTSKQSKLREIVELLDLVPVLNDELRELGIALSKETGATMIQCFEAMIPNAMRSTYQKKVRVLAPLQDERLVQLFKDKRELSYKAIDPQYYALIKAGIENKTLDLVVEVKEKLGKKSVTKLSFVKTADLSRAPKQQRVLEFFMNEAGSFEKSYILSHLNVTSAVVKSMVEKGVLREFSEEVYRDPFKRQDISVSYPHVLNKEQSTVVSHVVNQMKSGEVRTNLLHGITGSGKTEVYLQIIDAVLKENKQAIMLVPEIALTPQIAGRFVSRFQDAVAILHSGLSMGEKYDEWRKILRGEVQIVVGARSAIFAPFKDLGVIIVDEEHESTYKQEDSPRYHAIEVAKRRASTHHCPVLLGSATPNVESYARALKGVYDHLVLNHRAVSNAKLPKIELIDMKKAVSLDDNLILSEPLAQAILARLERKEQIVLLLNRRGYSNFLQCRECGDVVTCQHCDVSLTYHKSNQRLKCHYCGYEQQVTQICPTCQQRSLRFFGQGTQKVEEYLQELYPSARIMRMDVDTTSKKGAHQQLITAFENEEADILLGTQMVGKGLDFPKVTLVGVLSADASLYLSDFKGSERTFQLLTQVAGRAGRHELEGEVLIQSLNPTHYALQCVKEHDYIRFFNEEMKIRRQFKYPPYFYLCQIGLSSESYEALLKQSDEMLYQLRHQLGPRVTIIGPTMPFVGRVNNRFRMYFIIKYKIEPQLHQIVGELVNRLYTKEVQTFVDYYPLYLN